jgi:nitroimidazol reductase NimA-like FMN-containing flavoprotein (pyridoxamine 5'-phosphate oxidase superfamily)
MDPTARKFVLDILARRTELCVATVRPDGYPQANTVSYVNDGLVLYFGTDGRSMKVRNIKQSDKVSAAIDLPYASWSEVTGLSMRATASILPPGSRERAHAIRLLMDKFPDLWRLPPPVDPGRIAIVRILPKVVSMIDFRKGFGHTELVRVHRKDVARPRTAAPEPEAEIQEGGSRGIALDERLKRAVRQHPLRDEPRVDSVEPRETKRR